MLPGIDVACAGRRHARVAASRRLAAGGTVTVSQPADCRPSPDPCPATRSGQHVPRRPERASSTSTASPCPRPVSGCGIAPAGMATGGAGSWLGSALGGQQRAPSRQHQRPGPGSVQQPVKTPPPGICAQHAPPPREATRPTIGGLGRAGARCRQVPTHTRTRVKPRFGGDAARRAHGRRGQKPAASRVPVRRARAPRHRRRAPGPGGGATREGRRCPFLRRAPAPGVGAQPQPPGSRAPIAGRDRGPRDGPRVCRPRCSHAQPFTPLPSPVQPCAIAPYRPRGRTPPPIPQQEIRLRLRGSKRLH